MKKFFKIPKWLQPRLRLWSIYLETGEIPWRKPKAPKKKERRGVYMGARETIPFLNDDGKRTISHLFLRPGYMMRDYILRGQHERFLAPFTALLVFYSVFTLLISVVRPDTMKDTLGDGIAMAINDDSIKIEPCEGEDSTKVSTLSKSILNTIMDAVIITHLDLHPEAADTPWKESLAAVEGNIRSKGVPLFLGNFLLIWAALALLLRKYNISISGAAAISAYVLCQYCIFMFLALLLTFGRNFNLGIVLMGVLLFIDLQQLLGLKYKTTVWLTVKTGLWYALFATTFYTILGIALVLIGYFRAV